MDQIENQPPQKKCVITEKMKKIKVEPKPKPKKRKIWREMKPDVNPEPQMYK